MFGWYENERSGWTNIFVQVDAPDLVNALAKLMGDGFNVAIGLIRSFLFGADYAHDSAINMP